MILKLYEAETPFTVGLLFILYCLFETVLVFKPFSSSPLSSAQFVVCKSLRDLGGVSEVIPLLNRVYEQMLKNKELDVQSIIDFSIIENEDALKQSMNKLNDANHTARSDLLKVAFASIQNNSFYQPEAHESFQQKNDLLTRWGIPILKNDGPHDR